MKFKGFILSILACLFISGCDHTFDKLPYELYNDKILLHTYTDDYGIALGQSTKIYVIYGEYPAKIHKIPAGVAMSLDKFTRFSILQLLVKNKELRSKRAIKEAGIQQMIFKNKLPNYYEPEDLVEMQLGVHG